MGNKKENQKTLQVRLKKVPERSFPVIELIAVPQSFCTQPLEEHVLC